MSWTETLQQLNLAQPIVDVFEVCSGMPLDRTELRVDMYKPSLVLQGCVRLLKYLHTT